MQSYSSGIDVVGLSSPSYILWSSSIVSLVNVELGMKNGVRDCGSGDRDSRERVEAILWGLGEFF